MCIIDIDSHVFSRDASAKVYRRTWKRIHYRFHVLIERYCKTRIARYFIVFHVEKKRLKCVLALVIVQCLAVFFRDVLGSVVNLFPCPSWVVAQRYYEWFAGDSMGNRSTLFLHKRKRLPWCLFVTWFLNVHCLSYQCHCSSCPEPNTGGYLKLYLTPSASYWINFIYSSRYKAYCSF